MKLLLDTNIFLEAILDQEHAEQAKALLRQPGEHVLFISDFSFHSIGVTEIVALDGEDMEAVGETAQRFGLDFDDAYQYTAARKGNMTLVSFDTDFDRTDCQRITPAQCI